MAAVGVVAMMSAAGLVQGSSVAAEWLFSAAALAVSWGGLGLLVLSGAPRHRVGVLMTAAGGLSATALVALSWFPWTPAAWWSQWAWWPAYGLMALALLHFPDGRLPSPRWRLLSWLLIATTAAAATALAVAALDRPRTLLTSIDGQLTPTTQLLVQVAAVAVAVTLVAHVGVLGSLGARWRAADPDVRRQLACLVPAVLLLLLGVLLDTQGRSGAWALTAVAVPLGMTTAILRYRLYNLDLVINRTVVWLIMTLLVVAAFLALVALLREAVLGRRSTPQASLLATGVIAVGFEPLHHRVQAGVDRFLYGDRDDPYAVVARLGELQGRTVDPAVLLPRIAQAIASSLRVPYVSVEVDDGQDTRVLAAEGRPAPRSEAFPLVSYGRRIGQLRVATRSAGSSFVPRERRLLHNLAIQAATAVEATRLTRDLQASRERLVAGREEERRRLRRDLHDGLGPALAGMSMQVQAARRLMSAPDAPSVVQARELQILDALADDLRRCAGEVRQLVDELRPPALDGGLEKALRQQCERFDAGPASVELHVAGRLGTVPAAVEVAAYRIVAESLTNMARHSGAANCRVSVQRDHALRLEIVDDGQGLTAGVTPGRAAGVGLRSIQERAAELGGLCTFSAPAGGGTRVAVDLPLPLGEAATGDTARDRPPGEVSFLPALTPPRDDRPLRSPDGDHAGAEAGEPLAAGNRPL